ncbi:MAG TPA: FmdB family zinc ribbon protein [bacterium]|nr:FmdB family zinc ribbon protein [bacterium]
MPLYEYRCENCGQTFDVTHAVGGTPGPCPVCGGPARRHFTSVGLIFKGSGFYTTDHRKSSSADGKPSSSDGKSSSPDGDAAKTPAKAPASESSPSKSSPPSKP